MKLFALRVRVQWPHRELPVAKPLEMQPASLITVCITQHAHHFFTGVIWSGCIFIFTPFFVHRVVCIPNAPTLSYIIDFHSVFFFFFYDVQIGLSYLSLVQQQHNTHNTNGLFVYMECTMLWMHDNKQKNVFLSPQNCRRKATKMSHIH